MRTRFHHGDVSDPGSNVASDQIQIQTCLFVYVESIYILPLSKIDLKELTTKAMCPEKEKNQSQGSEDLA